MSAVNTSEPVVVSDAALDGNVGEPRSDAPGEVQIGEDAAPGYVPRPKRVACTVCRRRKLRCDGVKPNCGNCTRLGHACAYNEVRKKSGPKRGYVKQLEARLAQVETLLKVQDAGETPQGPLGSSDTRFQTSQNGSMESIDYCPAPDSESSLPLYSYVDLPSNPVDIPATNLGIGEDVPWEMIGLGLEEALPTQDAIDDLNNIYFQKIHPSSPMIHKPRYYAAMNLSPAMRPPICLRYMMWAHAAAVTDRYQSLHPHFYQRARKYAEMDEMKGLGESLITVAHAQCWVLITSYEFKMMYFPRAWMSAGRATRLSLMMGLHRQDGLGLDVKQCIPPARDWTEREERRRTFWVAFCQDRYASVGTGWPMMVDERDILTYLPASDEAFLSCKAQKSMSLSDALAGQGASTLSSFASVVILTCHLGRNLHHLHRPSANDKDHDLNGEFWKRHRALDNILLNTSLSLPNHLRLPEGVNDPTVVFCNMCIHTSTICLHQAAIFKAEKNHMPNQIAAESKRRCIIAADQITNIMKMISHLDLTVMNPFLSFCLYVAARVFVQYLRSRSEDLTVRSSLQFLISAMNALKSKNPLSQSFLVQLEFDLENSNLETPSVVCSSLPCTLQQPDPELTDVAKPDNSTLSGQNVTGTRKTSSVEQDVEVRYAKGIFSSNISLPSRQKPNSKETPHSTPHSTYYRVPNGSGVTTEASFSALLDEQRRALAMDIDMATDISTTSDRQQSNSDHSTPSTHQSSSNMSLSPHTIDYGPSSPKQQPMSSQTKSQPRIPVTSPDFDTGAIAPDLTFNPFNVQSTVGNPFGFTASWNYSNQNRTQPEEGGNPLPASTNITSASLGADLMFFEDLSWMQNATGNIIDWNNWQH
ncbi:hypothetical protein LOZ66_000860 [Ophidiomyces ophidiicola]|nr:hypothetical protein LOZ66_000860 [Ophidiomyces ophidiicola]